MTDTLTRNHYRIEAIRRRAIAKREARARGKDALRAQMAALNSAAQYYDPGYQQRLNPYRGFERSDRRLAPMTELERLSRAAIHGAQEVMKTWPTHDSNVNHLFPPNWDRMTEFAKAQEKARVRAVLAALPLEEWVTMLSEVQCLLINKSITGSGPEKRDERIMVLEEIHDAHIHLKSLLEGK